MVDTIASEDIDKVIETFRNSRTEHKRMTHEEMVEFAKQIRKPMKEPKHYQRKRVMNVW